MATRYQPPVDWLHVKEWVEEINNLKRTFDRQKLREPEPKMTADQYVDCVIALVVDLDMRLRELEEKANGI